jgi:hypothetical protein
MLWYQIAQEPQLFNFLQSYGNNVADAQTYAVEATSASI